MERTSFAEFTLCPNDPFMQFDDALTDRQPQPQAIDFPCEPGVDAMEAVEDTLKVLVRDTDAMVAHDDLYHLLVLRQWYHRSGFFANAHIIAR